MSEKRWYDVSFKDHIGDGSFFAESRSKAKYQAYNALKEASYFVSILSVGNAARVRLSMDQGDPRTPEYGVSR